MRLCVQENTGDKEDHYQPSNGEDGLHRVISKQQNEDVENKEWEQLLCFKDWTRADRNHRGINSAQREPAGEDHEITGKSKHQGDGEGHT